MASLYTDPVSGNQYNILVRLAEDYRASIKDLQNIVLSGPGNKPVLLGNLATIEQTASPVQIDRKYQQRIIDVTANVSGRDLGSGAGSDRREELTPPPGPARQAGPTPQPRARQQARRL